MYYSGLARAKPMADSSIHKIRSEAVTAIRLAIPLILGQVASVAMSFVDTLMAGRLGAAALAAVAVGGALWAGVILFILGTLMSVPSFVSNLDGAGRRRDVGALVHQAIWVALGLAVVGIVALSSMGPVLVWLDVEAELRPVIMKYCIALCFGMPAFCGYLVLRYLSEGLSLTRPTMYFGLLALIVNVPANYVLMYGKLGFPAYGAVGCGIASAIVLWVQFLALLWYIRVNPAYRRTRLFRKISPPHWPKIKELLKVGLPVGVAIGVEGSLFVTVALLMGSLGTTTVAGHQVAINFSALAFMIPLGMGLAATVRVGNAAGRGDLAQVRFRGWVAMGLVLITQAISATVMFTIPELIARVYTDEVAVISVAVSLLYLAAIFQLPDGIQACASGVLRGIKDTRGPMVITIIAYWFVGLPLGWWLGFSAGYGAEGMWVGLIAGLSVAAVLLVWRFYRKTLRGSDTGETIRAEKLDTH